MSCVHDRHVAVGTFKVDTIRLIALVSSAQAVNDARVMLLF